MLLELEGLRPRICCLDLDTFFVSVERLFDPSLVGKPVVIGGRPGQRGVVTACSYEARAFGVRSGMSLKDAGARAPGAVYLPGRGGVYGDYAKRVRKVVEGVAPEIQVASIDEMYLSFAGCERLFARPEDADGDATILRTVRALQATVRRETGLPCSIGVACTKTMAKVASGLAKPAGVLMVPAEEAEAVLSPLPVRKLPGVGPVAERKLAGMGIETLGALARTPAEALRPVFGAWTDSVKRGARGGGATELGAERPAFREHDPDGGTLGSISNERTFREDVRDPAVLDAVLTGLVERVCWRARRRGVLARTVTLKLRYADFQTLSRSRTITASAHEQEILPVARRLLSELRTRRTRIRLLGVAFCNLQLAAQRPLFGEVEALGKAVDDIRDRFGYDAVHLAPARSMARRS